VAQVPKHETPPPPKPAGQREDEIQKPQQIPLGLMIGAVAAAAVLFGALGVGLSLVFVHRDNARPEVAGADRARSHEAPGQPGPAPHSLDAASAPPSVTTVAASAASNDSGVDAERSLSTAPPPPPAPGLSDANRASTANRGRTATGPARDPVQAIQDATVFVKVQVGRMRGFGSGFVIQSEGDTVLVATNHHVVNPHPEGSFEAVDSPRLVDRSTVTVVFRSGNGPGVEQSLRGEVIADDGEEKHDLAILQVRGIRNPPSPIGPTDAPEPTITMPVLIYGFPFGNIDQQLDPSIERNPSITVNRGFVSSLRRDQFNRLARIQIDGSINPGNSGGPVVDDQGRLVGVSVAKIAGTNIGFAIPCAELTRVLDGRVGALKLGMQGESGGQARLQVEVSLVDPCRRIQSVDFLFAPGDKAPASAGPNSDGSWPPLHDAQTVSLDVRGPTAIGSFKAPIKSASDRRLLVQAGYRLATGKTIYTYPTPYQVPTRRTTLTRAGLEPPSRNPNGPVANFAALGPLTDPLKNSVKDCRLHREAGGMTIEVPAGVRLLSLPLDVKNAPMSLANVEGDFIAQVKIGGTLMPGTETPRYKGRDLLPGTFQGAGLVVWKDTKNFIRLERTARTVRGQPTLAIEALLEIVDNGKMIVSAYPPIPDQPLYLRIEREHGAIECMFSSDGRRWAAHPKLAVVFPTKLQVGLIASNAAKRPFAAQFEQFFLETHKKHDDEKPAP
jgi:S1-C subfamily serine protease/regulation of enolase protein 1 (concanavalin A-like superfamily)